MEQGVSMRHWKEIYDDLKEHRKIRRTLSDERRNFW